MSRPDEGLIHQWLDGECTPEESARIEALVASDPAWSAAVAEARGLIAASSRIVRALDAVPGDVIPAGSRAAPPIGTSPVSPTARGFRVRPWMRMAAGVLLVAGTTYAVRTSTRDAGTGEVAATVDLDAVPMDAVRGAPAPPAPTPSAPSVAAAPMANEAGRTAVAKRLDESAEASSLQLHPSPRMRGAEPERLLDSSQSIARTAEGIEGAGTGCWRIVSPDSLAGVRRHPKLLRESADTMDLQITPELTLRALRGGDALPGAVTAHRVPCEPE